MTHPERTDAADLVAALAPVLPLPLGSLRVWGDWFGRPMDNMHTAIAVETARNATLVIEFDEGETLTVDDPRDWTLDPEAHSGRLRIGRAARVTWAWFAYGRPKTAEHRHLEEHWFEDGRVQARSNADWYRPTFEPDPSLPAVEFL
jgi:hypothetical protein